MYQKYSRVFAVLVLGLVLAGSSPAPVSAANVSQINLDPNSLRTVQFSLGEGDAVESTQSSNASRSTTILNGYIQATDVNSTSATVTLVRNVNTGLEDARFCTALPSHAGKNVAPLDDFILSYTIPSNLQGYPLSSLPKTIGGQKNLIIPMSPYSNPTGYSIQIPRNNLDYDLAENRNMLDVCQPGYNPNFFSVSQKPVTGTVSETNGSYVSATFRVGDMVVLAPSGYRSWATLTLTSIRSGKANFTLNPQASDNDISDTTASFSPIGGVGSTDTNPTITAVTAGNTSTGSGSTNIATPSFTVPTRTPGMSQADYLTSVQRAYLGALGQVQSLATRYNQKESEITPVVAGNGTQGQGTTQATAQNTAAQKELSAIGLQIAALQAKIFNRGLAPAGSVGAAQPATPSSAVATGEQGCGNAGYENVGGEWKYVGCSGYYGQGAGNQQTNVAAGYKGADPSNAWDGPNGHYDENGVYHADVKFDRSRDADPDVDVRAGQLGVDYCPLSNGSKTICSVSYYDPEGVKLTQTPFNPAAMLTVMDRFGIDREQLEDLEKGMDKKNIPHLPYQMFPGTGSDAGINLTDLANGGLGTAYDWRVDPLCQSKGPTACQQVKANAQLADNLDIVPTPGVTKTDLTPAEVKLNDIRRQVVEIQAKI